MSDETAPTPAREPSERLVLARKAAGYDTAAAAARTLGASFPTYFGHENGSRGLTVEAATTYAQFFQTSVEWLLLGVDNGLGNAAAEALRLLKVNEKLAEALRLMRWWLSLLAKEIDLDEDETVIGVHAIGPEGKRELARISLRQIYQRADAALALSPET